MKRALTGAILLVAACGLNAQERTAAASSSAAGAFSETSAAQVKLVTPATDASNVPSAAAEPAAEASAAPASPAPTPAANPKYIFGNRDDYRWQLGVGFEYFRFESSQFDASLLGVNTSLAYYTNGWFAVEGDVIAAFSTNTIFNNQDHAKIFGGMGGFRIGSRRARWEPWGHALAGGGHLQPQTAAGSRNGIMAVAGAGVDYRVHARLSFRVEGDWVYSGFFNQTQNNFQVVGGAVLHF